MSLIYFIKIVLWLEDNGRLCNHVWVLESVQKVILLFKDQVILNLFCDKEGIIGQTFWGSNVLLFLSVMILPLRFIWIFNIISFSEPMVSF